MANKSLEIKTATIEIKVVRVDGHKMTKATFRQIQHDTETNVAVENILGWVSDDGIYILWNDDGKIKKRRIHHWKYGGFDMSGKGMSRRTTYHAGDNDAMDRLVSFIKERCDQLFIAT